MLIEYDKRPNATVDEKIRSLADSTRRALEELESDDNGGGGGDCEAMDMATIDEICTPLGNEKGYLPKASKVSLGCVIIGEGLNVRSDGTVWSDGVVMDAMTNAEIEAICK